MATCKMFTSFLSKALSKEININTDTLKVMLLTNTGTPSQTGWAYKKDVTASSEVSGTGYTATGQPLTGVSMTTSGNTIKISANNATWSSSTITARFAVIYDDTPATDDKKPLLGYVDFGTDQTSVSGDFKLVWDAAGIFSITIA